MAKSADRLSIVRDAKYIWAVFRDPEAARVYKSKFDMLSLEDEERPVIEEVWISPWTAAFLKEENCYEVVLEEGTLPQVAVRVPMDPDAGNQLVKAEEGYFTWTGFAKTPKEAAAKAEEEKEAYLATTDPT